MAMVDNLIVQPPVRFDVPATSPSLEMFWECMLTIGGAPVRFPHGMIIEGVYYQGPITISTADILEKRVEALGHGIPLKSRNE